MKHRNVLKWIVFSVALLANLFIIINSFIFGDASTAESNVITGATAKIINSISPGTINKNNVTDLVAVVRKLFGHFALFGFSGVFTTWAFYFFLKETKVGWFVYEGLISLGTGFAIAALSEFVQLFVPGRSASWADIGIDTLGYFIGVLLVFFIIFLAKKPIFSKDQQNEK